MKDIEKSSISFSSGALQMNVITRKFQIYRE